MKISKINYEICCDVPFCGNLAGFSIEVGGEKQHICLNCAKKLKNSLIKTGETNNAKRV